MRKWARVDVIEGALIGIEIAAVHVRREITRINFMEYRVPSVKTINEENARAQSAEKERRKKAVNRLSQQEARP